MDMCTVWLAWIMLYRCVVVEWVVMDVMHG